MTESQKAGWAYAIENAPPGLLRRIDRSALTVWVVAEDLHRQAVLLQSSVGLIVKTPGKTTVRKAKDGSETTETSSGAPMQSPYLAIINRQGLIMAKMISELGFSPVSRPRTQTPLPLSDSPDDNSSEAKESSGDALTDWFARTEAHRSMLKNVQ